MTARSLLRALCALTAALAATAVVLPLPAHGSHQGNNGNHYGHDKHKRGSQSTETSGATLAPAPDPQTEPIQPEPPGLPVQIIVQLKLPALPPGLTAQQILEMRRQPPSPTALLELSGRVGVGLAYGRALSDGSHVLIPDQLMTPAEATELIDRLRSDPAIDQVEVDQPVRFQSVPADPEYYRLWNLHPPGAVSVGSDFETAWDLHAGSPQIVIAVIDTGVLPHPDLVGAAGTLAAGAGNLASEGYDFISDCRIRATCPATTPSSAAAVAPSPGALDRGDWISASDRAVPFFSNCSVKDSGWHGTHVAGVTSAIANNNLGIAGGAYGARLLPVRVLGKCGGYISNVAEGIRWAAGVHPTIANPVPARVLNLSLGAAGSCGTTLQAAIDAAVGAGAVVVVAAGNEGADAGASMLPSCNNVLTVTATQTLGDAAYYSNRSTTRVAIAAPGGDTRFTSTAGIFSAANTGTTVHEPGGWTYSAKQGTSMATPHVSAAAGLMLSRNPALSPQQLRTILTAPATVTPFAPATQCAAAGDCGSGILNARRAVAYSVSPLRAAPASIDFGAVAAGAAVSQSVAVLNDSSAAVAVGQLTVSGNGFALAADGCTQQTLAPGGSCSVQVGFASSSDGTATATLMVPTGSHSEASITAVPLSASVGSKLSSAAPSVALGSVPLETTSLATVAFSNRAATPQQVASVTVSNAQIAALSANECANATLAPGAACSVTVAVTPLVEGPFTVAVSANTGGANDVAYTVALNGSAVVAPKNTATANPAPAAASGGGGCTILRGEAAAPDATLAALAIFALLWRRARRRVLS